MTKLTPAQYDALDIMHDEDFVIVKFKAAFQNQYYYINRQTAAALVRRGLATWRKEGVTLSITSEGLRALAERSK